MSRWNDDEDPEDPDYDNAQLRYGYHSQPTTPEHVETDEEREARRNLPSVDTDGMTIGEAEDEFFAILDEMNPLTPEEIEARRARNQAAMDAISPRRTPATEPTATPESVNAPEAIVATPETPTDADGLTATLSAPEGALKVQYRAARKHAEQVVRALAASDQR